MGIFYFFSPRNNAGVYSKNLEFSEDKIEMTFATNYLGNSKFLYYACPSRINTIALKEKKKLKFHSKII